jgi:ABC-type transport system involved in Fe-S cluster assembly fused permease/ATPase subunit
VASAAGAAGRSGGVLIITLRLIGPEAADEISVLPLGHVIERGRHSELIGYALFSV